jgi:hypothetical protein
MPKKLTRCTDQKSKSAAKSCKLLFFVAFLFAHFDKLKDRENQANNKQRKNGYGWVEDINRCHCFFPSKRKA